MAKHDVKIKFETYLPVGNVDVKIPVKIDGNLRGEIHLSTGTVDWRPAGNSKNYRRRTWSELADFLDQGRPHTPKGK